MKTIFALLVLALALTCSAQGVMTSSLTNAQYEFQRASVIATSAFDTLSETDSTTILSKYAFQPGWEYFLVRNDISGSGSDSVKIALRMDLLTESGTQVYSTVCDSMTALAGEAMLLPINRSAFAMKATIKGITYTGNGGVVILNRLELWQRRAVVVQQNWK